MNVGKLLDVCCTESRISKRSRVRIKQALELSFRKDQWTAWVSKANYTGLQRALEVKERRKAFTLSSQVPEFDVTCFKAREKNRTDVYEFRHI